MKQRLPMKVEVFRGPVVESAHDVMIAMVNERNFLTGFHGNADFVVYPRSSIKMLQAIPFVESGALEKFGLGDDVLALACSSHQGEAVHLELAKKWMEKIGVHDAVFHCGPGKPGAPRVTHNCSGKHLGLISTALAKGEDPATYWKWEHPVQARLRKLLTELTRVDHEKTPSGTDGCGIPTFAIPLQNLAAAMGHLLTTPTSPARKAAVARIVQACRSYPVLLGGSEDFVSRTIEVTHGRVILKSGAEGVYTGLLTDSGQAFAVKAHDGAKRAAEVATAHFLLEEKALSEKEFGELKEFAVPEIKNSRGEKVGEIRVRKGG